MIKSMNHVSFTVKNIEKSIDFYISILGFSLVDKSDRDVNFTRAVTGIEGAYLKIAYLKVVNCTIELVEYAKSGNKKLKFEKRDIIPSHVCFNVSDFDLMMEKIINARVKLSGDIQNILEGPNRGKKVVYFKDLDGNGLEFISI